MTLRILPSGLLVSCTNSPSKPTTSAIVSASSRIVRSTAYPLTEPSSKQGTLSGCRANLEGQILPPRVPKFIFVSPCSCILLTWIRESRIYSSCRHAHSNTSHIPPRADPIRWIFFSFFNSCINRLMLEALTFICFAKDS